MSTVSVSVIRLNAVRSCSLSRLRPRKWFSFSLTTTSKDCSLQEGIVSSLLYAISDCSCSTFKLLRRWAFFEATMPFVQVLHCNCIKVFSTFFHKLIITSDPRMTSSSHTNNACKNCLFSAVKARNITSFAAIASRNEK